MTKEKSTFLRHRAIFSIAGVLTIPFFLLYLLFGVNAVTPLATTSLIIFGVVNQTNQAFTITPVGTAGEKKRPKNTSPIGF